MILFNTFGYSLKQLENFEPTSSSSRIASVAEKVMKWGEQERRDYIQSISNLYNHLSQRGFNNLNQITDRSRFVIEIKEYVGTTSDQIAECFFRVLKKELKDGVIHNSFESTLNHVKIEEVRLKKVIKERYGNPKLKLDDANGDSYLTGKIFPEPKLWGIARLNDLYKRGKLILQPSFQRKFVWDKRKSSKLIESVILNFPIPLIYISEEPDDTFTVIDGQQRLMSIFSFIDGKYPDGTIFKLTGVFSKIDKKTFKDLGNYQDTILDYSLSCILFKKESDPVIKFEVFERLNRGSVSLNAQELRNSCYRGPYNDLLKELSQNMDFKFIMRFGDNPHPRMKDVEWVLRFAAFYHQNYRNYKSSKTFLNIEMENFRYISENESERLRSAFKNSVSVIRSIFGKKAFNRYAKNPNDETSGIWEKIKNVALYEVLMFSFAEIPKNKIQPHIDKIRESLIILMTQEDFKDSITTRTNNKSMVQKRFKIWLDTLDEITGKIEDEPRCFSLKLKKKLFKKNQTCELCGQNINDIDDAEVDHIEQYWLGGKTIPKNARLVHRYCNRSRSKYN